MSGSINHRCSECQVKLSNDEYALSLKLLGDCGNMYCLNCFAEQLGVTVDDLLDKIEEYKADGCTLFM